MNRIIMTIVLIISVCFTNGNDIADQSQISTTFVAVLWLRKTEILDRDIGSCESFVSYDFKILLTILAQFLQIYV